MQDFSVEGAHQKFGVRISKVGTIKSFLLGKTLNFIVIFQTYALKLLKLWNTIEKIWENAIFEKKLLIARHYGENYGKYTEKL